MQLDRAIKTGVSHQPHDIISNGYIQVSASCELTKDEKACFDIALSLIEKALRTEGNYPPTARLNLFFIDSDDFVLHFENQATMGVRSNAIIYFVGRWRKQSLSIMDMVVVMLEELCHAIWDIHDEYYVKQKVVAILKQDYPSTTLEVAYRNFSVPSAEENVPHQA